MSDAFPPRWYDDDGSGMTGSIIPEWAMEIIESRLHARWPQTETDGILLTSDVLEAIYPRAEFLVDAAKRKEVREQMVPQPLIGQAVIYRDTKGIERDALVTHVFPTMSSDAAGVNVMYVSGDEARTDGCGRQTERATSVVHQSVQPAHGHYWRHRT